uniref:Uncharacterized protein n=1 Tax=Anguilla anguilla TaxID=7936 RepID=A0A0E9WVN6_ANGAN
MAIMTQAHSAKELSQLITGTAKKTMATGLSVQKWQILITYWNCCDCYATGRRNS